MKKLINLCIVASAMFALQSCCTINSPQYCNADGSIGSKVGEAKSSIILFCIGNKTEKATLKAAATNGGIKKINHVEVSNKAILFGIVQKRTIRVYGD